MATVFDVAAQIRTRLGPVGQYKLNKLVYYVQAWSLVWNDRPAFASCIEAWKHGPVARDLWVSMEHGNAAELGRAQPLAADEVALVDRVLMFYGHRSATELIELTHAEEPWKSARGNLGANESSNAEISHASMRSYYTRQWAEAEELNAAINAPPAFVGSLDDLERQLLGE